MVQSPQWFDGRPRSVQRPNTAPVTAKRSVKGHVLTLPAEMPRVAAGGVSAYGNALALGEHETYGREQLEIWFISLLGPQQSVKSLWANLLKGQLMTIAWDEARCTYLARLVPLGKEGWQRHMLALPAASAHQLALVPKLAFWTCDEPSFLLLPRCPDGAARAHYRRLNRLTDLPLAPNWEDWLWSRALRRREATPLACRGVTAFHCRPNLAELTADVCAGVAAGVLTAAEGAERCAATA